MIKQAKCFYCGDYVNGEAHQKICLNWKGVVKKMKKEQSQKKTKYVLKAHAHIKLHPKIQTKVDKATEVFIGILIGFLIIGIAYLLIDTLLIPHPESAIPTKEEINAICDYKNMEANGYVIETYPKEIFNKNNSPKTYITCKTPYPTIISNPEYMKPECCYPDVCPQATTNPTHCNCIYLIYCYKKNNSEYIEWYYRINAK